jgi:hypothetical protein
MVVLKVATKKGSNGRYAFPTLRASKVQQNFKISHFAISCNTTAGASRRLSPIERQERPFIREPPPLGV